MDKLIHIQTILSENELAQLKAATKEGTTKEAIRKAIEFYIRTDPRGNLKSAK